MCRSIEELVQCDIFYVRDANGQRRKKHLVCMGDLETVSIKKQLIYQVEIIILSFTFMFNIAIFIMDLE